MTTEASRTVRYGALLASLLLLAIVVPIFEGTQHGAVVSDVVSTAILVSAIWATSRRRRDLVVLLALAVLVDGSRLFAFESEIVANTCSGITAVLFFAYATATILRDLLTARRVTLDTIGGAFCCYLMIGLAWGSLYFVIEILHRGSFNLGEALEPTYAALQYGYMRLIYYSIVTLTTVGYGDISPKIPLTQNLSALEAMVGQFYIAVLVARLVSIQIMQRHGE